ncbi:MAG: DUF3347 domain-containing protein [Balneolaceae bacterium]|nr:MAG: DUF3347 domain-containing protein [Balneolaceae bacterium]
MKVFFLSLLVILLTIVGCGPSEQERAQQQQREQQMQMQVVQSTPEFNEQMAEVLERYFDLKDALVASDAEQAATYAETFRDEVAQTNPDGLNEETTAIWVSFSEVMVNSSNELITLEDVDDQRYHFEYISEAMIEMVDLFRPVGYEIYHQSCPMVRGGSADWLSREEQIANPYHGDRMMRCGEVIRRL